MMFTFKRVSIALSVAALLAGCSSGVKLDENANGANGSDTTSGAASGVTGVDLTGMQIDADGGPKGVGRVVYFDFELCRQARRPGTGGRQCPLHQG